MDSLDLRWLEDVVEEDSGWGGIGFPLMHLSIKLSHVILMNMKYKAQSSREKSRDSTLLRGVSWKRNNNLCWCMKKLVVLFVCLVLLCGSQNNKKKMFRLTSHLKVIRKKVAHFRSFLYKQVDHQFPQMNDSRKFYFLPLSKKQNERLGRAASWHFELPASVFWFTLTCCVFFLVKANIFSTSLWTHMNSGQPLCFHMIITACPPRKIIRASNRSTTQMSFLI